MADEKWINTQLNIPSLLPLQPPPQNEEQVINYLQALHNYLADDRMKIARAINIVNYFRVIAGDGGTDDESDEFENQLPQNSKTIRTNERTLRQQIDTALPTGTAAWEYLRSLAASVDLDTTDFDGLLSATEDDLQLALDLLDDHTHFPIRTVTTTTDIPDKFDFTLLCDGTSNVVEIDLPTAVGIGDRVYNIKAINIDNAVTVDPNGTEEIDDDATTITLSLMESITIQSDNANWWII